MGEPRATSREGGKDPDAAMRRCFWAMVRGGMTTTAGEALTEDVAYRIASGAVGRYLTSEFGWSTCDHGERIKIIDALKRATGQTVAGSRQRAAGSKRRGPLPRRADGEARASLGQYQFMQALVDELHLSPQEFAGIARQATGKEHSSLARDIGKITEALKAVKRRRMKRAAQDAQEQQAAGSGQQAANGERGPGLLPAARCLLPASEDASSPSDLWPPKPFENETCYG